MTLEDLLAPTLAILALAVVAALLARWFRHRSQPDIDALIRVLSRHRPEPTLLQGAAPQRARAGWRPVVAHRHIPPRNASELLMRIGDAFSPSAPIRRAELLKGRYREVETLIDIAFERGQHAIVFGERGVGKTSLANVAAEILSAGGHKLAAKVTCDATDTFDALWRKALDELHLMQGLAENTNGDARTSEAFAELARLREVEPADIMRILIMITEVVPCALFIDEFDRLVDRGAKKGCAELLLELSHRQLPITLVILGVADGPHELLPRSAMEGGAVTLRLNRLGTEDLWDLLHDALGTVDMSIEDTAARTIVALSGGLPHFTHLIGQMSARTALEAERRSVEMGDVMAAIERYVDQTRDPIAAAYQKAVASRHTKTYANVLLASAIAETDPAGFFAAADIAVPLSEIAKKNYTIPSYSRHLHALAGSERGPALLRKGYEHRHRFRFLEPSLRSFTLIKGLAEGAISIQQLRLASRGSAPEESHTAGSVSRSS